MTVEEAKRALFGRKFSGDQDEAVITGVLIKLWDAAFEAGQEDGYQTGKDEGCQDCYQDGEDDGYSRGYEEAERDRASA